MREASHRKFFPVHEINNSAAIPRIERTVEGGIAEVNLSNHWGNGITYNRATSTYKFIEDLRPVTKDLAAFATALRAVFPRFRFGHHPDADNSYLGREAVVYVPGEPYARGVIGAMDYRQSRESKDTTQYMVYSASHVRNTRFKESNRSYHAVFSESVDRAVKNATKYLRPVPMDKQVTDTFRVFQDCLGEVVSDAYSDVSRIVDACRDSHTLTTELRNILRINPEFQFVTDAYKRAAKELLVLEAEYNERAAEKHGGTFVWLRPNGQAEVYDFNVSCRDVKMSDRRPLNLPAVQPQTLDSSELPIDIQLKLATLSSVEPGTSVPGVGVRITDVTCWVQRELQVS